MATARLAVPRRELFLSFLQIGLFGFGGIAASSYHVIVERRRWLTGEEYASVLGLGQVLPGANLINMATIVGARFQGAAGALLALAGLMFAPILILIGLATIYDRYADLPDVRAATAAAAAGAVGLTFGAVTKIMRQTTRSPSALLFALASFLAIGVLRLPMILTIAVLGAASFLVQARRDR